MDDEHGLLTGLDAAVTQIVHAVGTAVELFGVLVVVAGIAWASWRFAQRGMGGRHYEAYKVRIGRSLLLGLEVLVAADIVKSVALELTYRSLAVLAGLILVRTFLSWTLAVEIEGRWPWQRPAAGAPPDGPATTARGRAAHSIEL